MRQKKIKKQKILDNGSGLLVYADHRESTCNVIDFLESMGCTVKKAQLETGDYVISGKVAVERKTASDFLSSLMDGRLFSQLINLSEAYEQPLLLIEGTPNELFALSNIHKHAIIGALTSIALNYRVPVLFTENERGTAEFIYVIAKRLQSEKERDIALRKGKPGLTLAEQQRYVAESLPLVGPKTAKRLLEHFGSLHSLFNAELHELEKLEKMGPKKAKKIRKLIYAKYSPKKKENCS